MSWGFYIERDKPGKDYGVVWYNFKQFKVYWAYRWWNAEKLDAHMKVTPIKTQTGYVFENGNYAARYDTEPHSSQ